MNESWGKFNEVWNEIERKRKEKGNVIRFKWDSFFF